MFFHVDHLLIPPLIGSITYHKYLDCVQRCSIFCCCQLLLESLRTAKVVNGMLQAAFAPFVLGARLLPFKKKDDGIHLPG